MTLRRQAVGLGAGRQEPTDLVLELGPQHPSTHGALRLSLTLDGDRVVAGEPEVGYMHRGAEKLFEVRDYRQVLMLANRHDWLSAFSNELGVALAVEQLMGLEVPPRALWLRTLMAELNRVLSHLAFLGAYPLELGSYEPLLATTRAREGLQALLEEAAGGRMHYMFNRVGGLREDVPAGWPERARACLTSVRHELTAVAAFLDGDEAFGRATRGVGVLTPETVLAYGVSGPAARASGVDLDLRRDVPYLMYEDLGFGRTFPVALAGAGDSHARFTCLARQAEVSLDLAEACLDRLPRGAAGITLPKTMKVPEGHTYFRTESPLGTMGYFLVSRGERTPWRLGMRTASFNNVAALPALLPGVTLGQLATVLASVFFVIGDIDK